MATVTQTAGELDITPTSPLAALMKNAAARQLLSMMAIAASVAVGVAVVLWTRAPTMGALYPNLTETQTMEVVAVLEAAGVPFELDSASGRILVEKSKLYETRMMLAGQELPAGDDAGLEVLSAEPQFGLSSLQEKLRYEHATEVELARSISTLKWVRRARVHIARGNDSVFVRDRLPATASVILELASGRSLARDNVQSIVHMVSSAIATLDASDVTVVDQFGNLLSSPEDDDAAAMSERQFEQKKRKEAMLVAKLDNLLAPIIGVGRYRTQVNANLDFTVTEQTSQLFDPAASTVRSERETTSERRMSEADGGIPGALSNQPPVTGADTAAGEDPNRTVSSSSDTTRNFDAGNRITTTRDAVGEIVRLSVAVAVDDVRAVDAQGNVTTEPRSADELAKIERLVREAVGFDAQRGDTIQVINSAFQFSGEVEAPAPPEFWQEPWFLDLVRQGVGLLLALVVFFKILKPMARGVIDASAASLIPPQDPLAIADVTDAANATAAIEDQSDAVDASESPAEPPPTLEERVDAARRIAGEDPERVAAIMKDWVGADGE
ncbi:MAG: flagellar basal-body MS-ring/collar protein FliF [Pseudomonadota bacterium]